MLYGVVMNIDRKIEHGANVVQKLTDQHRQATAVQHWLPCSIFLSLVMNDDRNCTPECSKAEVAAYYEGNDEQCSEDERGRDHRDLSWQ